jgi:segregation and condensation protein B
VLENLLERRLVRIAGRKEAPGRPFLYETTREFLVAFGLRDVGDLPKVEGELIVPGATSEMASAEAPEAGLDGASDRGPEEAPATAAEEAPELAVGSTDAQTQAEQDPRPGGTDVTPGS